MSFEAKKLEFFYRELEFRGVLSFFELLGGKFDQKRPKLPFFGALRANIRSFEIHDNNFTTGSLSFGPKKALSF